MKTWYKGGLSGFFLAIIISPMLFSAVIHEDNPYSFTISPDFYRFHTDFQISSDDTYIGTIKKHCLRLRPIYELYDESGCQATGFAHFSSSGLFSTWASGIDIIDIYDTDDVKIGMIDGQEGATKKTKFDLYISNEKGIMALVGTALLNSARDCFTIVPRNGKKRPIAIMRRVLVPNGDDFWEVSVDRPSKIDGRIMRIFAGFIVDNQNTFLAID